MLQEEEGSFCYLEARQDRFPHQLKPWAHIVQNLPIPIFELATTAFQFASMLLIADVKLPQRKLYWKGSECTCPESVSIPWGTNAKRKWTSQEKKKKKKYKEVQGYKENKLLGGTGRGGKCLRTSIKRGRNVSFHFNQKSESFLVKFTRRECLITITFLLIYIPSRHSLLIRG